MDSATLTKSPEGIETPSATSMPNSRQDVVAGQNYGEEDRLQRDMRQEDENGGLHPYVLSLGLNDIDACTALEEATFPPNHRANREKVCTVQYVPVAYVTTTLLRLLRLSVLSACRTARISLRCLQRALTRPLLQHVLRHPFALKTTDITRLTAAGITRAGAKSGAAGARYMHEDDELDGQGRRHGLSEELEERWWW